MLQAAFDHQLHDVAVPLTSDGMAMSTLLIAAGALRLGNGLEPIGVYKRIRRPQKTFFIEAQ